MADVTPQFQSPDPGKEASQISPSQTQGDSPRETQPEDKSRFEAFKDKELAEFEAWKARRNGDVTPDQHGQFDDSPTPTVNTGRRAAPTQATKSDAVADTQEPEETPQSYVWLQNGEVVLADDTDLPGSAGNSALYGHWVKDGKAYTIVGVYPKEVTLKENK